MTYRDDIRDELPIQARRIRVGDRRWGPAADTQHNESQQHASTPPRPTTTRWRTPTPPTGGDSP